MEIPWGFFNLPRMKQFGWFLFFLVSGGFVQAQVFNSANLDTTDIKVDGKLSIHGFVDTYFAYSFNEPNGSEIPYQVSSSRHNEININLAYVDFRYNSSHIRASFVPAFGTYNNANYANEPNTLKNLLEANAGVCLSSKRGIWLDAGILTSPITNESPVSKDQFLYTRSLAAEYSPYFVTGARLIVPVTAKLNINWFLLNGWQQAQTYNPDKSVAIQFEYRPNNQNLINLNVYSGNEQNNPAPSYRQRNFIDLYWIHENRTKNLSYSVNVYGGEQRNKIIGNTNNKKYWWNANFQGRYWYNQRHGIAARIEHFNDPDEVVATSIGSDKGFVCSGMTLAYNYKLFQNCMVRFDSRYYQSQGNSFIARNGSASNQSIILSSNLSVWF